MGRVFAFAKPKSKVGKEVSNSDNSISLAVFLSWPRKEKNTVFPLGLCPIHKSAWEVWTRWWACVQTDSPFLSSLLPTIGVPPRSQLSSHPITGVPGYCLGDTLHPYSSVALLGVSTIGFFMNWGPERGRVLTHWKWVFPTWLSGPGAQEKTEYSIGRVRL